VRAWIPKHLSYWVAGRHIDFTYRRYSACLKIKLAILERLGIQIAQSSDAKKRINELQSARPNELYGILLQYVREGGLKHDEFYTLLPPNDYSASSEVRDILLAIAYEREFCQIQDKPFPTQAGTITLTPDETLKRIQEVGEQLCQKLPNLSRWIGQAADSAQH
jgi:CRISPR-associated protein Cst1